MVLVDVKTNFFLRKNKKAKKNNRLGDYTGQTPKNVFLWFSLRKKLAFRSKIIFVPGKSWFLHPIRSFC